MIADWLIIVLVVVVLWAFWFWLTALFDWITEQHASARRREDSSPTKGTGSS